MSLEHRFTMLFPFLEENTKQIVFIDKDDNFYDINGLFLYNKPPENKFVRTQPPADILEKAAKI